jgi:hypothetical protein
MSRRWAAALAALVLTAPLEVAAGPATADVSGSVYVSTVPALPNVQLNVGSAVVSTAGDGSAWVDVSNLNGIAQRVSLANDSLPNGSRLAIRKVVSAPHAASHEARLTVGFDVRSLVRLRIDPAGTGVALDSLRSLRLHSIVGDRIKVDPAVTRTVRLLSRRARLVSGELRAQKVTWSVDRIEAAPGVAATTGTPRFDPFGRTRWLLRLEPVAGTVHLSTVPPTPGVSFLLDGAGIITDRHGNASAPVSDLNEVNHRLRLARHTAGSLQVSLLGTTRQKPRAVRERRVVAALAVRRPVTLRFVDHDGRPVPTRRITQVRLTDSSGAVELKRADLNGPVMLLSGLATQIRSTWQVRPVTYSIAGVQIDGSQAVFAGRQRVAPNESSTWVVALSLFTVTVQVHDVLFGARVTSKLMIARPDGSTYSLHVGGRDPTVIPAMVRGMYDVTVHSAVVGARSQVLVSRNDAVDLRVVTPLDAALILLAGLLLIASLIWGGIVVRRRLARAEAGRMRSR